MVNTFGFGSELEVRLMSMKKVEEAWRDLSLLMYGSSAADCVAVIHVHSHGKQLELVHRWTSKETLIRRRQIDPKKKR